MIALPPALAPWSRELSMLDRELALDLGAIVRRLASLIGTANPMRRGLGDVDGFDGLAQRGPYDRLLHSEWLLADELPEEFARRAAMNEHVFFELARQHPVQHPLTVALFDTGPSQIGAPRLVHLAALIVLARRAASSQAGFRWGFTDSPEHAFFEEVRAETIAAMLDARTAWETTEEDLAEWQRRLCDEEIGELWIIGPPRLSRFPFVREQWLLEVDDVPSPDRRQVSVTLRHDTRREPAAKLDLPSQKHTVRLLSDPFPVVTTEDAKPRAKQAKERLPVDIASDLLVVNRCNAVMARATNGDIVAIMLPAHGDTYAPTVHRLEVRKGEVAIAAGWWSRHGPTAVFVAEDGVRIRSGWRTKRSVENVPVFVPSPLNLVSRVLDHPVGELKPLISAFNSIPNDDGWYFIDPRGDLWFSDASRQLTLVGPAVAMRMVFVDGCYYIHHTDKNEWGISRSIGYRYADVRHRVERAGTRAFFGPGHAGGEKFGPIALELADGRWLLELKGPATITIPPDMRPIGVTTHGERGRQPGLVCVSGDWRSVDVIGYRGTREIFRADAAIVQAVVAPDAPVLVVRTADNVLVSVSLASGKPLFLIPLEGLH